MTTTLLVLPRLQRKHGLGGISEEGIKSEHGFLWWARNKRTQTGGCTEIAFLFFPLQQGSANNSPFSHGPNAAHIFHPVLKLRMFYIVKWLKKFQRRKTFCDLGKFYEIQILVSIHEAHLLHQGCLLVLLGSEVSLLGESAFGHLCNSEFPWDCQLYWSPRGSYLALCISPS